MEKLRRRGGGRTCGPRFERFGREQAHWLDDYALFSALKAGYGGASYLEWPAALVRRTPAALERARRERGSQIDLVRFAQFLLFHQGARLKSHARAKGVRMIGDLPFFVSLDSSDVWAHPEPLSARRAAPAARGRGGAAGLLQRAGTAVGQSGL
jgi:4-alpha-glucanotransferase